MSEDTGVSTREHDVFEKLDALLKKHHPEEFQTAASEIPAQPDSDETAQAVTAAAFPALDIPTLTDIVPEPLDETGNIPTLTEIAGATLPDSPPIELDLVPETYLPEAEYAPENTITAIEPPEDAPERIKEIVAPRVDRRQSALTEETASQISDALTEQALRNLDKHLQQVMETQLAPLLVASLDKTLASMLDQFAMHIEYLVREAVAEEMKKQLQILQQGQSRDDDPES